MNSLPSFNRHVQLGQRNFKLKNTEMPTSFEQGQPQKFVLLPYKFTKKALRNCWLSLPTNIIFTCLLAVYGSYYDIHLCVLKSITNEIQAYAANPLTWLDLWFYYLIDEQWCIAVYSWLKEYFLLGLSSRKG